MSVSKESHRSLSKNGSNDNIIVTFDPESDELLTRPEVMDITKMSQANIYRLMALDKFPKPIRIGEQAVRWLKSEIIEYVNEKIAARA